MVRNRNTSSLIARGTQKIDRLPHGFVQHSIAVLGEVIGTWMFLFLAFAGTQVANTTQAGELTQISISVTILYIALSFGFSLAVNAWVFFRISGGLFNPAVTLGLCVVDALPWSRGAILFAAQMLGAILAAATVYGLFPGDLKVQTTLNADTSITQGLFIEMFLTTRLLFTIFMLAAEKHRATFIAPIGIGLSLFVSELTGVYFTGGSMNPARSFAPSLILWQFEVYHWIYWVGPLMGALLAAAFYKVLKTFQYENANPGQDHDGGIVSAELEKGAGQNVPTHARKTQTETERYLGRRERRVDALRAGYTPREPPADSFAESPATTPSGDSMYPALEVQPCNSLEHEAVTERSGDELGEAAIDNQRSKRARGHDTHRRAAHMWAEGHHVDASGHRTWV